MERSLNTFDFLNRYDHLNNSIMSRGKQLHSGMNSLNSFQPAADRFCSWLSEVESNIEMLEAAGDKLRIKYKDKQIPDTELVKFKVGALYFDPMAFVRVGRLALDIGSLSTSTKVTAPGS